ncbi:MAG TPA: hypothetical protein VGY55_24705 [Pirellulales bacterium]|nr:hypothetical protein [Pirellulales bacterium]
MSPLPRLAVGSIQPDLDCRAIFWALLDVFDRIGLRVQSFLSRACLQELEAATTITGTSPRHLDSWLMTAEACRERFLRTARVCDLSIVEGTFADDSRGEMGSRLSTLSRWLALPRLGIVDMPSLSGCQVPAERPAVDALLIDRVVCSCDFYRWQTILESLWGIPVLGGLDEVPCLRAAIGQLGSGRQPPRGLCEKLGDRLLRHVRPWQLLDLAAQNEWPGAEPRCCANAAASRSCHTMPPEELVAWNEPANLTVAVAYDDAFFGYFPDTLEALEQRGVVIRDFSPLRDEALPQDADLVYIGCGRPDLHARDLAENHCLAMALRDHVCAGKRIYAEGGGMAYLCQQLALPSGERVPMAGILPAVASVASQRAAPLPVELTLASDLWLGSRGQRVRGYLNENWQIESVGALASCAAESERRFDLVERHQAVGSRVHLNLALQPALLEGFLRPSVPALAWALPR